MENHFFKHLMTKISEGRASDEDLLLYQKWYDKQLLEQIDEQEFNKARNGVSSEIYMRLQPMVERSASKHSDTSSNRETFYWKRWSVAAAAALVAITFGLYFLQNRKPIQILQKEYRQVNFENTQGVILKLANGKEVDLSNTSSDSLNQFTNKKVVKIDDGIQYDLDIKKEGYTSETLQEEKFNTLYTPTGKTFQIVLADGTKVWLNAKSMLRFPINFIGQERRVQLIGEGYFEVIKDSSKPFVVESKGQVLKVLGTKFNIDAYDDSRLVKSTLLEGKVLVNAVKSNRSLILEPGDQSLLSEVILQKQKVLLKNVLGWKNGIFVFQNEKFGDICNSLSRWYNVEFDSSQNPKILNQIFSGTVPKFSSVDEVLTVLSESGTVNYKREGRRIVFMD